MSYPVVLRHRSVDDGKARVTYVRPESIVAIDLWPMNADREHPRMDVHFAATSIILWRVSAHDAESLFGALQWYEWYEDESARRKPS